MPNAHPTAAALGAWRSMVETHALLWRLLEDELEHQCGLSLIAYEALLNLSAAESHKLRLQDLVSRGQLTKSGVSRLVDRLEREGLIRLESCPSDRRGTLAVLSPEGRSRQSRAAVIHLRGVEELFARHLDDNDALSLRGLMERVRGELPGVPSADSPPCASPRPVADDQSATVRAGEAPH